MQLENGGTLIMEERLPPRAQHAGRRGAVRRGDSEVIPLEPSQVLRIIPGDGQAGLQRIECHKEDQRQGEQAAGDPPEALLAALAQLVQHQHRAEDDEGHAGEIVVDEGGAGHQHPGQELAGEAD